MSEIDCFLFDLGGVLVDWTGIAPLVDLADGRLTPERARRFWLESAWVRAFECGQCTPAAFGEGVVAELALSVEPMVFLSAFAGWDKGPLPGALELVRTLKQRYRVACLSNNNEIHWNQPQLRSLAAHFDPCLASFQIGLMKPDRAAYDLAIQRIGKSPQRIIYFDDNPECVQGAQEAGLQAYLTKGLQEVRDRLAQFPELGNL